MKEEDTLLQRSKVRTDHLATVADADLKGCSHYDQLLPFRRDWRCTEKILYSPFVQSYCRLLVKKWLLQNCDRVSERHKHYGT